MARCLRTISVFQGKNFILLHRKGAFSPQWQQVLTLPDVPALSPWHVLVAYVALTAKVPQGSPVLRALTPPFAPLSANRVGSLTRAILRDWGIPHQFGPHSTRGAGVFLYKSWGLSSEHVCEVGRWKDHQAFRSHYLRLQATETVADAIRDRLGVHRVSSTVAAEPDCSAIPRSPRDSGMVEQEGEAARLDETCYFWPAVCNVFVLLSPLLLWGDGGWWLLS